MITGFTNGFFAALTRIKTDPSVVQGGYEPKEEFTGVKAVDQVLVMLVTFFAAWLDAGGPMEGTTWEEETWEAPWLEGLVKRREGMQRGRTWDVDVPLWMAMVQFAGAWALVSVEGARRGNQGRVVGW